MLKYPIIGSNWLELVVVDCIEIFEVIGKWLFKILSI